MRNTGRGRRIVDPETDTAINALYQLSTVYVSAHHSEGWGFPLSDAMIFKKPVIATGYSGNLEFMNLNNSLLLDFVESEIKPQDCFWLFSSGMRWAYPDVRDLERKMLFLYESANSHFVAANVQQAAQDILRFDRTSVGQILLRRLSDICACYL